jgi:hypothetical protein
VGCAVERKYPKGFGRIRMAALPDASAVSLSAFLADHVEPGATVVTDGWSAYPLRLIRWSISRRPTSRQ